MENRRFMLIALLGVVLYFLYNAWQTDYAPKPNANAPMPTVQTEEAAPTASATDAPAAPGALEPKAISDTPTLAPTPSAAPSAGPAGVVHVVTDLLSVELSLRGGEVRRVELLAYPLSKKTPDVPLPFLNDRDNQFFVMQSG
ncbi:MAG TPA: membrane protein insertase YidC, partial [Nevskiaceae bacterium]|nr:membrane protein insertase YidC [Nevskiaceae bacterium]